MRVSGFVYGHGPSRVVGLRAGALELVGASTA